MSKRAFEQHGPVTKEKKNNTNKLVYFRKFVSWQCISFANRNYLCFVTIQYRSAVYSCPGQRKHLPHCVCYKLCSYTWRLNWQVFSEGNVKLFELHSLETVCSSTAGMVTSSHSSENLLDNESCLYMGVIRNSTAGDTFINSLWGNYWLCYRKVRLQ